MANITLQMLKMPVRLLQKDPRPSLAKWRRKKNWWMSCKVRLPFILPRAFTEPAYPMQSRQLAGLLHVVKDVERVGDHAHNIAQYAEAKSRINCPSELAINELELLFGKVEDILPGPFRR